ncbi:MAG: TRAP transporter permease [Burkholderiales bacterium]|jgi:TRAP transporter 4TM/12TM fusion protein|nr:TRAP transporter permease [Burkholderiales bacterium]
MRKLEALQYKVVYVYIVIIGLFHLYTAAFGTYESFLQRNIHLMMILPLAFLLFPAKPGKIETKIPWYDLLLAVVSALPSLYVVLNYESVINRIQQVDVLTMPQVVLGIVLALLLLEGTRRVVGLPIVLVAFVFGSYMFFADQMPGLLRGSSFNYAEVIEHLYLTDEGIFSSPLGVSATFVIIFLIFGGFLEKSGAGPYFMEVAKALTGALPGGPALVAVVSSCLLGSINGSAVANVYGTGSFTIPLMKRLGYRPAFAGAVESVASSGGQLMPPVMGAGAFLMASFLHMDYLTIVIAAILPALLYYGSVLLMVWLTAVKNGMRGLSPEEIPDKKAIFKRAYLLLPIVGLVYFLVAGYTPMLAGLIGIAIAWVVSLFNKGHRMGPLAIFDAIFLGTRNIPLVCLACATAGIVLGSASLTGVGGKLTGVALMLTNDVPFLALFFVMIISIILGMGLPTTGAYILASALCAPALIKLGFLPLAAHMFVFYYAILSNITPPVALAAFAASSIAESPPMKTSLIACKLGILAFIVPYAFCHDPGLLMQGNWQENVLATISACAVLFCIGFALMGYINRPIAWWERLVLAFAAYLVLRPEMKFVLTGVVLLVLIWVRSWYVKRGAGGKKRFSDQ